ncbi:MAG: right-handed parallel beta-helix repeat-containing protein [Phycisphaerales bacterium]
MPLCRALTLSTLALAALAGTASAQSFNVDINSTSGFGAGVPASTYAGAAGQPGTWNSVLSSSPNTVALTNLNGTASAVSLTRATNGTFINTTNLTTNGNFSLLHDDYQRLSPQGTLSYTFSNLEAGTYAIFTYAANPDDAGSDALVSVPGSSSLPTQSVGGAIVGNKWIPGTTHAVHIKQSVPAGGSITVNVLADSLNGFAACGGFQLVKMTTPRLRVYVNDNAPGIDAGGSWNDAYTDLQMALKTGRLANGALTEIWVSQGFYEPGTARTSTFTIPANVEMYGGFAGTETSLAQRTNPAFFITALSGAIGTGADTDNSYNVVTMDDSSEGTNVIDGFTISRGYANGVGTQSRGAGVLITGDCSPRFRNCKFLSNTSQSDGGAVYVNGITDPHFTNCLFFNNDCDNATGGALYMTGDSASFRIANCEFTGNYAIGDGGAFTTEAQPGEVVNTIFSGNIAASSLSKGGAVACKSEAGDVTFRGCTFSHNLCGGGTGGIYATLGADVTLRNCILWDNADVNGPGDVIDNLEVVAVQGSTSFQSFTTIEGSAGQNGHNPLFVDANGSDNTFGTTDDNLRLTIASPCIDAADSNQVGGDFGDIDGDANTAEATPFDLDMSPRRQNIASVADTGANGAPMPDRGAYELVPAPCVGDLNGDGNRDTIDLIVFLGDFGTSGPGIVSDLNNDNTVNTQDLTQFLGQFGVPCP